MLVCVVQKVEGGGGVADYPLHVFLIPKALLFHVEIETVNSSQVDYLAQVIYRKKYLSQFYCMSSSQKLSELIY